MNDLPDIANRAFPIGEYVREELDARGWSVADAAIILPGEVGENALWLELICCVPIWFEYPIEFTDEDTEKLSAIFGTSQQMWINLHKSFRNTLANEGYVFPKRQAEVTDTRTPDPAGEQS